MRGVKGKIRNWFPGDILFLSLSLLFVIFNSYLIAEPQEQVIKNILAFVRSYHSYTGTEAAHNISQDELKGGRMKKPPQHSFTPLILYSKGKG